MITTVVCALTLWASPAPSGEWKPDSGSWALQSPTQAKRWVIIRDLGEGHSTGIYHVEVLERLPGQQRWQFKRLAAHMAVTTKALRASVVRAIKRDEPYPELFREGLARWRKLNEGGQAPICATTITDCLRKE